MVGEVVVTAAAGGGASNAGPSPAGETAGDGPGSADTGDDSATGSDGGPGADAVGADASVPAAVSVVDDAFLPDVLEVTAGQEVVWTNDGAPALDTDTAAAAAGAGGLSLVTPEVLMLGAFAVALAGFTALSRRIGAMDAGADA